jgi:hypothetical protein
MNQVVKNPWPCARLITCLGFSLVAIGAVSLVAQDPMQSTNEGVYTSRQASRGARSFEINCTSCHTSRFTVPTFFESWSERSLADLFGLMQATMPEDNPGSLRPQEYADVLSFILSLNGFPAGETQLEGTEAAMQAVQIQPPPSSPAPETGRCLS